MRRSPGLSRGACSAAWLVAGLLIGGLGGLGGCLVDLDHRLACGDGYTDLNAGEECDPGDPLGFATACRDHGFAGGRAACDPETCQLEVDAERCAVCGDGEISPGEECDPAAPMSQRCVSGEDLLACNPETCTLDDSACPHCGNGVVEPELNEECDWNFTPESGTEGDPLLCAELKPLGSIQNKGYSSGQVNPNACTRGCQFPRDACSFCGDGEVDGSYTDVGPLGTPILRGAEICDGRDADADELAKRCGERCLGAVDTEYKLRCDFECVACGAIVPDAEEPRCCIRAGGPCDPNIPCCFALDHPEKLEPGDNPNGCAAVVIETPNGTIFTDRCRAL